MNTKNFKRFQEWIITMVVSLTVSICCIGAANLFLDDITSTFIGIVIAANISYFLGGRQ